MEQGAALFEKADFCIDRGYDDNKMFLKLDELEQYYIIRLRSNRKLLYHNKWTMGPGGAYEDIMPPPHGFR